MIAATICFAVLCGAAVDKLYNKQGSIFWLELMVDIEILGCRCSCIAELAEIFGGSSPDVRVSYL